MSDLKTFDVLGFDEIKDGEMKEVSLAKDSNAKVLLSRLGDKVFATSAFCTHYGAPLAKGTLSSDGCVRCPWHQALFNVQTGDIEDSPGINSLVKFEVSVEGGRIIVKSDGKEVKKEGRGCVGKKADKKAASTKKVVIVGGGSAAFGVLEGLEFHGSPHQVTIVSAEPYLPIDRTKLSKALPTSVDGLELRGADGFKGVEFKLDTKVTKIVEGGKGVELEGGEVVKGDWLVIATGGTARSLPIKGKELDNILTLRALEDAKKIAAVCTIGTKLVFVGSSFIAMEAAVAALGKECDITVIGMETVPFERVLGKEVGAGLLEYHMSKGIKFYMEAGVEEFTASGSDSSKVGGVKLKSGEVIPADAVILGVGVKLNTDILAEAGVDLEKDGSVKVDEQFKVKGLENTFAIGDIATYPTADGDTRIEHWNVSGNHGRSVGGTIAGTPAPFTKIPTFWSAQGQQLRYCGNSKGFDNVFIKGSPKDLKFEAYYAKGDTIIAVASMAADPLVTKAAEAMRLGKMPKFEEIKNSKADILALEL